MECLTGLRSRLFPRMTRAPHLAAAPAPRRRAVLLSGHYYASKRKANFHFLADSYARQGWDVTFVTTQISPISRWRGDLRFTYPVRGEANQLVPKGTGLTSYVWYTPFHVFHMRSALLDRLTQPLARLYANLAMPGLEPVLAAADLILVESSGALLLVDRLRRLNPRARLVYRVSDDIRNLGQHAAIVAAEREAAPVFDLISAPSRYTVDRFQRLPNIRLHPHGIEIEAFERETVSPYPGGVNVVSVGTSFFDPTLIPTAAEIYPNWIFHVIGNVDSRPALPNIRWYGEMAFDATVPFIQHADIGLAPYLYRPGAETLADSSLKLNQSTWCHLPAVAPPFALRADRPHIFPYEPGNRASIGRALAQALAYPRQTISRAGIRSWDELALLIADGDSDEKANDNLVELRRYR
jgi:2-beta-glucuronyltransferase